MTKSQKEVCKKIAEHYSASVRLGVLQEEAAELIVAVSKIYREAPDAAARFIDALADVSIMVQEQISRMDEDEHVDFQKKINEKLAKRMAIVISEQGGSVHDDGGTGL